MIWKNDKFSPPSIFNNLIQIFLLYNFVLIILFLEVLTPLYVRTLLILRKENLRWDLWRAYFLSGTSNKAVGLQNLHKSKMYTTELIQKFCMERGKPFGISIVPQPIISDIQRKSVDEKTCWEMISWPDIMINVFKYARFELALQKSHLTSVKTITLYLIRTQEFGLWYPHYSDFDLIRYSAIDFVGDKMILKKYKWIVSITWWIICIMTW